MKKHATTILLFVVMFVGLGLLLYPPLADWYNSFHQSRAIARYTQRVDDVDEADYAEYWAAAHAYNERLLNRSAYWRIPNAATLGKEYDSLLKVDESGIMGVIEIPEIAVMLPLYHGTSDMVLQVAVGHLHGTSLPTGGPGTHSAFSAHRGLPSAKLFTNLDQLDLGDLFTLSVLDEVLTYEIDQIVTVLPTQLDALEIVDGEDYCSLITCTPYGVNSHRLIIRGHRVPNDDATARARIKSEATAIDPMIIAPIVAAPLLVVLLIVMLVTTSPKRRKKSAAAKLSAEEIVQQADKDPLLTRKAASVYLTDEEIVRQTDSTADVNENEGGERP